MRYPDGIAVVRAAVAELRDKADAIVALTHLSLEQDAELAAAVPEINLVLGGHENENWLAQRGPRFVPVVKADANGRTLAIVTLTFRAPGAPQEVASRLLVVDERIAADPVVDAIARAWVARGFEGFCRLGFESETVVAVIVEPLDGCEVTVRNRSGRLTDLIAAAMAREAAPVDTAIFNGGSVRIDDVVPPGPITGYDVLRVLPFGGKVTKAGIDGALIQRALDTGVDNEGTGSFLHAHGVKREGGGVDREGRADRPRPSLQRGAQRPPALGRGGQPRASHAHQSADPRRAGIARHPARRHRRAEAGPLAVIVMNVPGAVRHVTDPRLRTAMVAEGYVSEAYGPLGVAMCGPAQ